MLGAIDLVITDKTGTITKNRLAVSSVSDASGLVTDRARRLDLLTDALRAEEDAWEQQSEMPKSSFTRALIEAIVSAGGRQQLDPGELISAAPPTDSQPYSSTTARRDGRNETLTLGAPEAVADLALAVDGPDRQKWHARIEELTSTGQRVVGLAIRREPHDAVMLGLIGFADPVRNGVAEAMIAAREAGIHVVIVTGDHPSTALAIGQQVGLAAGQVITGSEVEGWSDSELVDRLPSISIVARSTPETKERIVRVGPSRRPGRCGHGRWRQRRSGPPRSRCRRLDGQRHRCRQGSLGSGPGRRLVRDACLRIQEGRRIVDNVQKGLVFLVSTHVALLGFILIATVAGFSQALLPIQVLWLELFIDLSASVAFEREPIEPNAMHRPPRPSSRPLLTDALLGRIAIAGGFTAAGALWLMAGSGQDGDHARWLAYCTLVCAQAVRAYANRTLTVPLARLGPNMFLLAACLLTVAAQIGDPVHPSARRGVRGVPLTAAELALVAGIALAPAALAELVRRRGRGPWVA